MYFMNKTDIGKKLRAWLIQKFGSISEGARLLEISPNALSTNYFSGKSYPGGELLARLKEFGCDINWLLSDDFETSVSEPRDNIRRRGSLGSGIVSIPILGTIPAGKGADYYQHDWPEYFPMDFNPSIHFCLKVDEENGLSMMPVIMPGDIVLCNRNPKLIKDGSLVAVRYEETKAAIKKIQIQEEFKGGPLLLVSANPAVVPMVIPRKNVNEIYKVVAIFKK